MSREINFSSVEEITQLRLEQRIYLEGSCIEGLHPSSLPFCMDHCIMLNAASCLAEWLFTFGFVIPGSTNTWQQTIEAAGPENMLDPNDISGKLTIETAFYDGQSSIAKTVYRIFYV